MSDDLITTHGPHEFSKLPWDLLDPAKCAIDWSFSLINNDYSITITRDENHWDRWIMPKPLSAVLKMLKKHAITDTLREIRRSLGIYD